jgi:intracellular septation protein A
MEPGEPTAQTDAPAETPPAAIAGARAILLGNGPRFARDAFGPVLVFYVVWKLVGLPLGIVAATLVALGAWQWERRHERPGLMARISLCLVLVQAAVGLLSNDAKIYLAQPVLIGAIYGLVFIGSVFVGRPLAGVFATEMYPFPPDVRASATFRKVFSRISLAWGVLLFGRACARLATLSQVSVDRFIVVNFITGAPLIAGFVSWSIWYGRRGFEKSEEWGWAFADGNLPEATP